MVFFLLISSFFLPFSIIVLVLTIPGKILFFDLFLIAFFLCVDVDDVKFVINFDYPNCSEDYVHRIGRTGRSSRTGTAYTFFTPNNAKQAQDLVGVLTEANQVINPKLYELSRSSRGGGGGRGGGK